ncbi:hypothetical protein P43SY_006167 [Pythium insidiosum]|uniref:Protein kinase domain-containing protein n=1 Tax=Pythium insidiosum TaxID=114742 RepID=A0AAD5LDQ8_PYTIN|nr:hypothetical protein P43SY_006167 [Pythium insidiosum]
MDSSLTADDAATVPGLTAWVKRAAHVEVILDQKIHKYSGRILSTTISGGISSAPWHTTPWRSATDGINYRWKSKHELSPAEKFAMAFALDVEEFQDHMSSVSGVDAFPDSTRCVRNEPSACPDGFVCGVRPNHTEGRCISPSAGLQDAWGRASLEVEIPACPVVKNGVTFYPEDLKALVTQFYFMSERLVNQQTRLPPRHTLRFGPEFPTCQMFSDVFFDDEGACRNISPGLFFGLLLNIVGRLAWPLLVRFSSVPYFVPIRRYRVRRIRDISIDAALAEFGPSVLSKYDPRGLVDIQTGVSVITMEVDWVDLAREATEDADIAVMRTVMTFTNEVWANEYTVAGIWLEPSAFFPVSVELPIPLAFEQNDTIGLTQTRIGELLQAAPSCHRSQSPRSTCNRVPLDVVLKRMSEKAAQCELASGFTFKSLSPIDDTSFPAFCRRAQCIAVAEEMRRIEYPNCLFPNGFDITEELDRIFSQCFVYTYDATNFTMTPRPTTPASSEPPMTSAPDRPPQTQLIDEIKLNAALHHPNIVALIGATWTTRADLQAIFEYMCDGDLRAYLETTANDAGSAPMWSRQKLQLALDVAYALAYLHSQRPTSVVHRDLKSGNILLCRDTSTESRKPRDDGSVECYRLRAKLADFGVSRSQSTNNSMTTGVGTSRWLAPEVILGGGVYDTACDVYSFGVVLTELDTHQLPFSDVRGADGTMLPDVTILQRVAHERLQPNTSASCPESVASLARQCMAYDAKERPNASAICRSLCEMLHDLDSQAG